MVVAQLVRVLVCGAEGRGFEPHQPPVSLKAVLQRAAFFVFIDFHLNVLSQKQLGKILGVDGATVCSWELE